MGDDDTQLLDWYASAAGMRIFTSVPAVEPGEGPWPAATSRRSANVGFTASPPGVEPFEVTRFEAALTNAHAVTVVSARGYADRTVFGHLSTRLAYLARRWDIQVPMSAVAVVRADRADSNMADAYEAAGYGTTAAPGASAAATRGGGGNGRTDPWDNPRPGEDRMLHALWERCGRHGWWLAEVPFAFAVDHRDRSARRVDAVVVDWPEPRHSSGGRDLDELHAALEAGRLIELIEAKRTLSASVIGQLQCAQHLFQRSWGRFPSRRACTRATNQRSGSRTGRDRRRDVGPCVVSS